MSVGAQVKIPDIGPLAICTQVQNHMVELEFEGERFWMPEMLVSEVTEEKEMNLEDMVRELFELTLEVQKKTDAYAGFDISNHGYFCSIYVMEHGFDTRKKKFDAYYRISPDEYLLQEAYQVYFKAKEYLEGLLYEASKKENRRKEK